MELNEKNILILSVAGFVIVLFFSLFAGDPVVSTNLIFLGVLILFVPYSIFRFLEFKKIKAYEESFPNFLRDLSESQRAGLSILQSIKLSAKADYGILSEEIKKIDSQLSWNVPLEKVLDSFAKRMKKSKMIVRSILVIEQSNKSGGNVEDTMDSLADNMEMLKDVQEEKNVLLSQQVMMMYAIFFIFLGISIALLKFLIPLLQSDIAGEGNLAVIRGFNSNPCYDCLSSNVDPLCSGCNMFFTVSDSVGFGEKEKAETYYKSVFFVMIIVQGFFSGLIAGQIGSDSLAAGVKHSLIMLITGIFLFLLVTRIGII
jgi:archaeal flagellar protein FlaJ